MTSKKNIIIASILVPLLLFFIWPEKKYKAYEVGDDFQKQVDNFYLPTMPPDWSWHYFEADDGTKLRWGETGNRGAAKATVIIIPGYSATMSMYGEHADMLARRGYHVVGIDMRGQGGSDRYRDNQPEKLWIDDFKVYSDDLASFIKSIKSTTKQPIIPIGVSFGGHVAVRMAGEHMDVMDSLVLVAPAIVPKTGALSYKKSKFLIELSRFLGKSNRYLVGQDNWKPFRKDLSVANINLCASNPKRLPYRDVVFTRNAEERVGGVTAQWAGEFLSSSEVINTKAFLSSIDIPVTMISAEIDHLVETNINQISCDSIFPNCTRVDINDSGHCLFQESDEILNLIFDSVDDLLLINSKPMEF